MTIARGLVDLEPRRADLRAEVLWGLRQRPKRLPCKLLYDTRGSELYERITRLPEYYPTRTEIAIQRAHVGEIAALVGRGAMIVEYGSGSSEKTRMLLDHLEAPAAYVPVDISRYALLEAAEALQQEYPAIEIRPVCADYTEPFELPEVERVVRRRVVYFPGSTLGNFERADASAFLRRIARAGEPGDALLLGLDLDKDRSVLEAAYDDARGVTADFNRNILRHVNSAVGGDFDPERFEHVAFYDNAERRIEMHLRSDSDQIVRVGGERITLQAGEMIWTESSYKYRLEEIDTLARGSGFRLVRLWTDPAAWFSSSYLVVAGVRRRLSPETAPTAARS